ncbi:MAG: hypothetical protein ACKV2Q_36460 [Planctomycetaceae bacterium]
MKARQYDNERSGEKHYAGDFLDDSEFRLDLTTERFRLADSDVSMLIGADITRPGALRTEHPRLPVGAFLTGAGALTNAQSFDLHGVTQIRYKDVFRYPDSAGTTGGNFTNLDYTDTGDASGPHILKSTASSSTHPAFAGYALRPGDWVMVYLPNTHVAVARIVGVPSTSKLQLDRSIGPTTASPGGVAAIVVRGIIGGIVATLASNPFFTNSAGWIKDAALYDAEGPWPAEMAGGILVINGDRRNTTPVGSPIVTIRRIDSVTRSFQPGDTLRWSVPIANATWTGGKFKFHILYRKSFNRRGVWVTDGRRFWILKDGEYIEYADLGDDDFLGQRWRGAMIANNRVMFSCPAFPPRVFRLDREPSFSAPGDETYAGCLTPVKPLAFEPHQSLESEQDFEPGAQQNSSFNGTATGTGQLTSGEIRAKVRAISDDDNLESKLVNVFDTASPYGRDITASLNGTIKVFTNNLNDTIGSPPLSNRWTHLEIWRTRSGTLDYHLESVIEVANLTSNEDHLASTGGLLTTSPVSGAKATVALSDTSITPLRQLTSVDITAGGLPPVGREVINLLGTTLVLGAADDAVGSAVFYSREFLDQSLWWVPGDRSVTWTLGSATRLANYTFREGDQFVVVYGGDAGVGGIYDIEAKVDNESITLVSGPALESANMIGYIRRPYTIDWPVVASDEEVWYSRTDKFAPESFPTRVLILSRIGDVFKRAVNVGNAVAVIMQSGVHIVFKAPGSADVDKKTIAPAGAGTPWEDSVVVVDQSVLWATRDGPKIMAVADDFDAEGRKATIETLEATPMIREWFREADAKNERIDAGVDLTNRCVRWRRKIDANTYQSAQYCYFTKRWTLLDDDTGAFFVDSQVVEADPLSTSAMYSIGEDGAAFRENYDGLSDALSDATVQDKIDSADKVTATKIIRHGAFSEAMLGCVVRFVSDNADVDGEARVIRVATEDRIEFDAVSGLDVGDEFIIGAVRFRIRFAKLGAEARESVKTLERLTVRALPGKMNTAGPWSEEPDGLVTVAAYQNFSDEPTITKEREIAVRQDSATQTRESALQCNGTAIEVELSCDDARTSLVFESVEASWREEGDTTATAKDS